MRAGPVCVCVGVCMAYVHIHGQIQTHTHQRFNSHHTQPPPAPAYPRTFGPRRVALVAGHQHRRAVLHGRVRQQIVQEASFVFGAEMWGVDRLGRRKSQPPSNLKLHQCKHTHTHTIDQKKTHSAASRTAALPKSEASTTSTTPLTGPPCFPRTREAHSPRSRGWPGASTRLKGTALGVEWSGVGDGWEEGSTQAGKMQPRAI